LGSRRNSGYRASLSRRSCSKGSHGELPLLSSTFILRLFPIDWFSKPSLFWLQSTTQGTATSIPTATATPSYHEQECGRSNRTTASLFPRTTRSTCTSRLSLSPAPSPPSWPSIWLTSSPWRSASTSTRTPSIKLIRRPRTHHRTPRRYAHACTSEARSPGSGTQNGRCCKRS
jgi:hypothetical protein